MEPWWSNWATVIARALAERWLVEQAREAKKNEIRENAIRHETPVQMENHRPPHDIE